MSRGSLSGLVQIDKRTRRNPPSRCNCELVFLATGTAIYSTDSDITIFGDTTFASNIALHDYYDGGRQGKAGRSGIIDEHGSRPGPFDGNYANIEEIMLETLDTPCSDRPIPAPLIAQELDCDRYTVPVFGGFHA